MREQPEADRHRPIAIMSVQTNGAFRQAAVCPTLPPRPCPSRFPTGPLVPANPLPDRRYRPELELGVSAAAVPGSGEPVGNAGRPRRERARQPAADLRLPEPPRPDGDQRAIPVRLCRQRRAVDPPPSTPAPNGAIVPNTSPAVRVRPYRAACPTRSSSREKYVQITSQLWHARRRR